MCSLILSSYGHLTTETLLNSITLYELSENLAHWSPVEFSRCAIYYAGL